jgi:hypothetical protein
VVSYSAVPLYGLDVVADIARESARVLKAGAVAIHGPMPEEVHESWSKALHDLVTSGKLSHYNSRVAEIEMSSGEIVEAFLTEAAR